MDPLRGAELDAAVERQMETDYALTELKEMYADLDHHADSRDISVELTHRLREAQQAVHEARVQAEKDLDAVEELLQ